MGRNDEVELSSRQLPAHHVDCGRGGKHAFDVRRAVGSGGSTLHQIVGVPHVHARVVALRDAHAIVDVIHTRACFSHVLDRVFHPALGHSSFELHPAAIHLDRDLARVDMRAVTAWALLGSFDWNSLVTDTRGYYESGAFDACTGPHTPF